MHGHSAILQSPRPLIQVDCEIKFYTITALPLLAKGSTKKMPRNGTIKEIEIIYPS
jgi:hypothetical protein